MPRITKRALFAAHINLSSHAASLARLGSFLGFKFKEDLMSVQIHVRGIRYAYRLF